METEAEWPMSAEKKADLKKMDPVLVTIAEALEASQRGDEETYFELVKQIPAPPGVLMAIKMSGGADRIRRLGFDTSLADEKYGPGWLDRDDEE